MTATLPIRKLIIATAIAAAALLGLGATAAATGQPMPAAPGHSQVHVVGGAHFHS